MAAIRAAYGGDFAHVQAGAAAALVVTPPTPALPQPVPPPALGLLRNTLTVSRDGSGAGSVTSAPAGIACGRTCAAGFGQGVRVTLRASASADSVFRGWAGKRCSGSSACTVTMSGDLTVRATFSVAPLNTHIDAAAVGGRQRSARFTFHATGRAKGRLGFQCALVSGGHRTPRFTSCRSPRRYTHLAPGAYSFRVRASDRAGTDRSASIRTFTIPGSRSRR